MDQIFAVKKIVGKYSKKRSKLFTAFINLEKAMNKVEKRSFVMS